MEMQSLETQTSYDRIRQLVRSEGKSARNLVTWSVPAVDGGGSSHRDISRSSVVGKAQSKRAGRGRQKASEGRSESTRRQARGRQNGGERGPKKKTTTGRPHTPPQEGQQLQPSMSEEMCVAIAEKYSSTQRQRSTESPLRRANLQARYWSYLFDNLHSAIDKMYFTCEADESVIECQEVIMTLDMCRQDFEALIRRIELQQAFENADVESRPPSLAWEVRKTTSPTKQPSRPPPPSSSQQLPPLRPPPPPPHPQPPGNNVRRQRQKRPHSARSLDFEEQSHGEKLGENDKTREGHSSTPPSWADRVRGVKQKSSSLPPTSADSIKDQKSSESDKKEKPTLPLDKLGGGEIEGKGVNRVNEEEKEGWETVTRSRSRIGNGGGRRTQDNSSRNTPNLLSPASDEGNGGMSITLEVTGDSQGKLTEKSHLHKHTVDSSAAEGEVCDAVEGVDGVRGEEAGVEGEGSDGVTTVEQSPRSYLQPGTSKLSKDEEEDWGNIVAEYEAGSTFRSSFSWADRCESPPDGLPEIPRSPGRAVQLHQRLSSPSRKRQVLEEESRRLMEEKQSKAQQHRDKLLEEKTQKSKLVTEKIREARESRDARLRHVRETMEGKLQRAEHLRESHLQEIVRKAQEEEAKVSEISFINTLEAQNKKIEVFERYQGHEARLLELQEERQRRREEQLAKEEATQERRRAIEAERLAKLMEKRRDQNAKVELLLSERERVREEAVKEKARERERKLVARNAAIQLSAEELEKRIQLKHNETSRRYDAQLEQRKAAAVSVSSRHTSTDDAPRIDAYPINKWCSLCHVKITSEVYLLSHLRGRKHQEALLSQPITTTIADTSPPSSPSSSPSSSPPSSSQHHQGGVIIEAPEEHQGPPGERPEVQERARAGRKRAKKLRRRLAGRVREVEGKILGSGGGATTPSKLRQKLQRALKDFNRQLDTSQTAVGALERALGEMGRSLSGCLPEDQLCFCQLGGVASLLRLLLLYSSEPATTKTSALKTKQSLPEKTLLMAINVLHSACAGNVEICRYLFLSNKAAPLIDLATQLLASCLSTLTTPTPPLQRSLTAAAAAAASGGVGAAVVVATEGGSGADSSSGNCSFGGPLLLVCGPLLSLLAEVVSAVAASAGRDAVLQLSLTDTVSYAVCVGLMDQLGSYFNSLTGPTEDPALTHLLVGGLNLLVAITACMHHRVSDIFSPPCSEDPTLLTTVLCQTEVLGLMQLLYAILLHDGPTRHSSTPPPLTYHTIAIATAAIKTINNCAILDLAMVQMCLGAEGISLEFRHVVSYLLWHCSHFSCNLLLHELILVVGYFSVLNQDNQVFLQSGRSPTLLQLLCDLPFEYFSNPELSCLLYPTLVSACYQREENRAILQQEISCKLLVAFLYREMEAHANSKSSSPQQTSSSSSRQGSLSEQHAVCDFSSLAFRFPRSNWKDAVEFFSSPA